MNQLFLNFIVLITKLLQINYKISLFSIRLDVVFKLLNKQPIPIKLIQCQNHFYRDIYHFALVLLEYMMI